MEGEEKINWVIIMSDELYRSLPSEIREAFIKEKAVYDDHKRLSEDATYTRLYKSKRDATKALDEYKFRKRYP